MTRELANENHRKWMLTALEAGAGKFGLTLSGQPVFGWNDRSVGAQADGNPQNEQRWLRVVTEHVSWARGDWWTGNADSSAITGVRKPQVLDLWEWQEGTERLRAELMTLVPGEILSPTPELNTHVDLMDTQGGWWSELRRSIDQVAQVSTKRMTVDQDRIERRLRVFFGDQVDPLVTRWAAAHGDLHWANLLGPKFGLLDWELWGLAPAGYDAATLYCYSLSVPSAAARVHETFAELLDSSDGVRTQLYVITRLLLRAERGDHSGLVIPLHRHARTLLSRFTRT